MEILLAQIKCPNIAAIENHATSYSIHYWCHSLKMQQAICDYRSHILLL